MSRYYNELTELMQDTYLEFFSSRQEAAFGFDDDLEYCPILTTEELAQLQLQHDSQPSPFPAQELGVASPPHVVSASNESAATTPSQAPDSSPVPPKFKLFKTSTTEAATMPAVTFATEAALQARTNPPHEYSKYVFPCENPPSPSQKVGGGGDISVR
ncbi:uncharacterized protein VTP21DRAFT_10579 [Calcarisporiella thermophila]|uniref:uncharacterized protein n=1 Tax=Calcarisporiella thermophila TaxID=911321 RepID=UPI0037443766